MGMTRQERIALHKKQERIQVRSGVPDVPELTEGVPELRSTAEGLVEYIRHNNVLYKNIKDRLGSISGGFSADFDSGWVDVTDEVEYEFIHDLGSKMLLQQWYFKSDGGLIFNIQSNSSGYSGDNGVFIEMETINQISVGIGNTYIFKSDTTAGGGSSADSYADGYLRCFLWKIEA